MRHIVSEPKPGSVIRLQAGDWLEVQLSHTQAGSDWEVLEQPGCLFPLTTAVADRPTVLPVGPRHRSLGFLAFGAAGQKAQALRLALVNPQHPDRCEIRELSVLVG